MDKFPVQKGERTVRFGCGALFGFVVVFLIALRRSASPTLQTEHLVYGIVGAVVVGLLATWLGDSFWSRIPTRWPWW